MIDQASISTITNLLKELDIASEIISRPGEITLAAGTAPEKINDFEKRLEQYNMYFIFDRKNILSEKVKHVIVSLIENDVMPEQTYSSYISGQLHLNYTYLANIFSETQNITIEHFMISKKIEKASKLLSDTDLNISQISDELNYSSIGHFSGQFKKVTGVSPSQFRKNIISRPIS